MSRHEFTRVLTWRDFKVVPKSPDGRFDACTFIRFSYKLQIKPNEKGAFSTSHVSVTIMIDHHRSWVVKGKQTDDLLKHEQAHYKIAAVAGRTLETKLAALSAGKADDLKSSVRDLFDEIAGQATADGRVISPGIVGDVQTRYDEDAVCGTDHSRNAANQAIWQQRITSAFFAKSAEISRLNSCPRLSAPTAADPGEIRGQ